MEIVWIMIVLSLPVLTQMNTSISRFIHDFFIFQVRKYERLNRLRFDNNPLSKHIISNNL